MPDLDQLEALLNMPIKFGLEQQGHIPTIQAMRAEGKSWHDIGRAIGWTHDAAEVWYGRWCERELIAQVRQLEQVKAMVETLVEEWDDEARRLAKSTKHVEDPLTDGQAEKLSDCADRLREIIAADLEGIAKEQR